MRNLAFFAPAFALVAIGALSAGCSQETFGDASDPLPVGAIKITYASFTSLQATGQLREITSHDEAPVVLPSATPSPSASPLTAESFLRDPAIQAVAARNPQIGARLKSRVEVDGSQAQIQNDGTVSIQVKNRGGEPNNFSLQGDRFRWSSMLSSAQQFGKQGNQLEIYRVLRSGWVASGGSQADYPEARAALSVPRLQALNTDLVSKLSALSRSKAQTPTTRSPQRNTYLSLPVSKCLDSEIGSDPGAGDQRNSPDGCGFPYALGLQSLSAYPGRSTQTCVKNQGARGSCVSFAVSSALESALASLPEGKKYNLSEQDIYFRTLVLWPDDIRVYGDGTNSSFMISNAASSGYPLYPESAWPYNAAYQRINDTQLSGYAHSCDGVSLWCSDTAGQGALLCAVDGDDLHCGYATPTNGQGLGHPITGWASLWDLGDPDTSLSTAQVMLSLDSSRLILEYDVTDDFSNVGYTGYGTFTPDVTQKVVGGHASHLVGAITNAELATLAPTVPAGAGGGYVIIKNSWGKCAGDTGYYYMPFDWVKKYTTALVAITSIQ